MSDHRAPRTPGGIRRAQRTRRLGFVRSARVRAVLGLGVVLGVGFSNTLAYWTDTGTLTSTSIQAGTLDLKLDGNLTGAGGTYVKDTFNFTAMIPGDSLAMTISVQNPVGSTGFAYTGKAFATGDLAPYLKWTVVPGASAGAVATNATTGVRTQTCSTGTATFTDTTLATTAAAASAVIPAKRTLATNTSENVCVRVTLPDTTSNDAQGDSAAGTFIFDAAQLGAP